MKFTVAAQYAVLSFLSLTNIGHAAPVDTATQSAAASHEIVRRDNHCGDSVFVNESSDGSPLIADCEILRSNIVGGGTWTVNGLSGFHSDVASYGTCKFTVYQSVAGTWFYIGNEDIRDLIASSIAKFAWNGKVGASGTMDCDTEDRPQQWTHWGIYHT